jgi:RimJ/RimL family protein N-acetyltransferase
MSKIILRPWRKEDAQQLAAIANNRNVWLNVRDRFPHPYTVMDAMQWIAKESSSNPITNFAVIYDGKIAGSAGLLLKDDIYKKNIEVGYFVGEHFWNKGIASEAVRLLCEYAIKHFDVVRLYAEVFAHNPASMKVLEKNGFMLESIRRSAVIKDNVVMDDHVFVRLV